MKPTSEIVACIIPCRNNGDTLARAVKSAYEAGCDIVAVHNDASSDHTPDVIKALEIEYPYLHTSHSIMRMGVNFSRNYLVDNVHAGLIIPLDADDELIDIRPLVKACQPNSWVYGDYLQQEGLEETLISGSPAGMLSRKELTGITFLFHKDDWLKVGGYDSDFAYCEDWAMQCNLTHAGVQPVYVPTPIYRRHLKANGNERTSRAGEYWNFYHLMARRKYSSVFTVNR